MIKQYNEQMNVGKAKYVVNFYSGKQHKDGSPFFDVKIFSNKKEKDIFVLELVKLRYKEV